MSPSSKYVPLPDSERDAVADAKVIGDVDPQESFEITVQLRPKAGEDKAALLKQLESQPLAQRQYPSRDDFAQKFGADPADVTKVEAYAHSKGLDVVRSDPASRTVTLQGTAQALTTAFPAQLKQYESSTGRFRGRTGPVQIPEELQGIVEGIFGFDNREQAKAH
jgi:kumamolisin